MRSLLCASGALVLLSALLSAPLAAEENEPPNPNDDTIYKALPGMAPPVAPPLRKGSPLDHLANDPKYTSLAVGYKEGRTDGPDFWIAHRLIDPDGGQGWGWVRKPDQHWGNARWIALQETLGVAVAPHRHLQKAEMDADWEFKFWGKFAPYKAYDPRLDEQLPVFVLEGYEVLGQAAPLTVKVGPPGRIQHRPSGASSREGRPILSDPGVD
jgi:hypothetical protein